MAHEITTNHHNQADPQHHVTSVGTYVAVFVALLVLTAITVIVSQFNFGMLNTPVALGIATVKATLVVLYFMHVRHATRLTWVVIAASLLWVGVLFTLTFSDYLSRGMSHM